MNRRFAPPVLLAVLMISIAQAQPSLHTIYNFSASGPYGPWGGVTVAPGGSLYGTTQYGGTYGWGTVWRLTPPASSGAAWDFAVLYSFKGFQSGDGYSPQSPPILGPGGVLYGMTPYGGGGNSNCLDGCGIIYSLTPPATPGGSWVETILYIFGQNPYDGATPFLLKLGADSSLYGAAAAVPGLSLPYMTTLFRLTPPSSGGTWTKTVPYWFREAPTGLTITDGAVYVVHSYGGSHACGAAFQLTPPASAEGSWTTATIYNFPQNVCEPNTALVKGRDGALYGTTLGNGQWAAVYELAPPAIAGQQWTFTTLYQGSAIGTAAYGLAAGPRGTLYGASRDGGPYDYGALFALVPPASSGSAWTETTIFNFQPGNTSAPSGPLAIGPEGTLYGTTFQANSVGPTGAVFEVVLHP